MTLEVGRADVAEGANTRQDRGEEFDAALAVAPAGVVFAGGVVVMDHGVADHQPDLRVDRHEARIERPAVDQERASGRPMTGDELVHDAATHADEVVLGALAGEGERRQVDGDARGGEEGIAGRDLQRGGGGEAGAERHIAVDEHVDAGEPVAGTLQHQCLAEDVIAPVLPRRRVRFVEIELERLVHQERADPEFPVRPRRDRGDGRQLQRRREDEAVIVVGVLADDIDAARGPIELRLPAEDPAELLDDLATASASVPA